MVLLMERKDTNLSTNNRKKTSIGGQALIEGILMQGPQVSAMAVRKPDEEIVIESWPTNKDGKKPFYKTIPFIRGAFNFVSMMVNGYKCVMRSAELAEVEIDEEPSAFEKKLMDIFGDKFSKVVTVFAAILGVFIAVGLFMVLPTIIVGFLKEFGLSGSAMTAVEAVVKISIFIIYMAMMSKLPDMRRVFEYHGAEHKTIACYEANEELTVENVRKHTRFHPRCGTSFLLIVIVVSILVFSQLGWGSILMRVLQKIILLPLVVGISYEVIKLAGRYDNFLTRVISAPGMWLQHLTTAEPDDSQIEVAIAAMKVCIPENSQEDIW